MTESLYVLEPGAYLRREGASLKVMKGNETIRSIPAEGLKRLMLVGYVSLTGPVVDFLIQHRVETVFVTPTGRFRARLGLDEHRHVESRRRQYLRLSEPSGALAVARRLVAGKLENFARFLVRRKLRDDPKLAVPKLRALAAHATVSDALEKLRGVEGAGTRIYFEAFPRLIQNEAFFFRGRNRRPPLDPVNAMLSFVYTLLTNAVQSAIGIAGLDPYLGALHEVAHGRPSLACDLVEEYRAFLGDRLVLGLINRGVVTPSDFILREDAPRTFTDEKDMARRRPVEMTPAAAKALIASFEEMMARKVHYPPLNQTITYRWLILNQVRRFGESLSNPETPYEPFLWRV